MIAATAVGLPLEAVRQMMPPGPLDVARLGTVELDQYFREERKPGPLYAIRLVVARMLYRAIIDDDRAAVAAQIAVFRTLKDWTDLGAPVAGTVELELHRLTRRERATFRRLYSKARGMIDGEAEPPGAENVGADRGADRNRRVDGLSR